MIALTIAVAAVALVAHGAPRADAQAPDVATADYDLGVRRFVEPGATGRFARIPIRLWGAVAVPAGSGPGAGCRRRPRLPRRRLPGRVRRLALLRPTGAAQRPGPALPGPSARQGRLRRRRPRRERVVHRRLRETQDHEYRRYAEVVDATLDALRTASAERAEPVLRATAGVDPTRIGLVGHSRGGKNLLPLDRREPGGRRRDRARGALFDRSVRVPDVPTAMLLGTCDDDTGRTGAAT